MYASHIFMLRLARVVKESNHFDLIRIILAVGILLVHSAGITDTDELRYILNYLNGDVIVKCFFVISGYLVMHSYNKKPGKPFFIKRILRVFPAYYAAILFTLLLGTFLTRLSFLDFITSQETLRYVVYNMCFLNFMQSSLPAVFDSNPLNAMDGSLWTIKSELILYVSIPLFIFISRKSESLAYGLTFIISVAWVYYFMYVHVTPASRTMSLQFVGMASYFFGGAYFSACTARNKSIIITLISSAILYLITKNTKTGFILEIPLIISATLYVTLLAPRIVDMRKCGDYSYGLYLYHFPVMQTVINYGLYKSHPYLSIAITFTISLIFSVLSWHCLERKCLNHKENKKSLQEAGH